MSIAPGETRSGDVDHAPIWFLEANNRSEESGFSGSGGAEQNGKLSRPHIQ
jgi:hypothetical protein